jgi:single-stranded DNA-binding protein
MNVVVLHGVLSRAPDLRELASGTQLVLLEVSTAHPSGRATVPVAWLDPPDHVELTEGVEVVITGHVRRRFFRAAGSTQSRTEVVADQVVAARSRARARRAVERALASVDERLGA